jgi:ribosome recycling factor
MEENIQQVFRDTKDKFEKTVEFLKTEMKSLRSSRPSSELVEDIQIDSYGQKMPLKHLATITVSPPNLIIIQPWDKHVIEAVCGAITRSGIGMQPIVDKDTVKLSLPPLSEERRKDILKVAGQKCEEAKIALRKVREDALRHIKEAGENGSISEDELFKAKEKIQALVDEYNGNIKDTLEKKEKEILEA